MVDFQRPAGSGTDVSTSNPNAIIYIKGDANTDGSIRIIPDTSFDEQAEFQLREGGVWNDTGILIAASTVYLGRELQLSAGGEYLLTKDFATDIRSLVPHVRFDAATGTDATVAVPVVGALVPDVIIQPDDTGEISGSTIQFSTLSAFLLLANALILKTGTLAGATDEVTVNLYRTGFGTDLFYKRTYAASEFPINSDIKLTTDGLVELFENQTFYVELTTPGTLTLKADVTDTTPYFGGDFYFLTENTITPDEDGGVVFDILATDQGDVIFDDQGEIVVG